MSKTDQKKQNGPKKDKGDPKRAKGGSPSHVLENEYDFGSDYENANLFEYYYKLGCNI